MAWLVQRLGILSTFITASVVLASCGANGAVADARHSCVDVNHALSLQQESEQPGLSAAQRDGLQAQALSRLLKATPFAARATSIDGTWNPLMTTINEAERVPLADLAASLERLCRVANSKTPYI